jgi:hypothetical protein
MKKKKSGYESGFVKAKKKKLGDEGWAKLVDKVNAEEREKKRARFKQPEVDLQKIKDAITLEFASQDYYKEFEIRFEPSKFTDPETLEEKTTSTTLLIITNKVTDEMNTTLDKVFKIYKNGNTDEVLQNAIKWLKKQPRIIKGNIRDYNAIDASKEKTSKLFVNTFHALGKRFNGRGGVMK